MSNKNIKQNKGLLFSAAVKTICALLIISSLVPMYAHAAEAASSTTSTTTMQEEAQLKENGYYVKEDNDRVWIRAKVQYVMDSSLYGIDDSAVTFHNPSNWTKTGEWFYYNTPVDSGDKIRLFDGFSIPSSWDNKTAEKGFKIIVTVEASEMIPTDTAWNSNSEVCYSTTFDVYKAGNIGLETDETITKGTMKLKVVEYEIDKDGNEVAYVNDKMVLPGQKVSKIVEIQVEGSKGKIWKLVKKVVDRRTGDASNIVLWAAGICASATIIGFAVYKKRRKKA